MYCHEGDMEIHKVVNFYIIYTSIYFSTIFLCLCWSGSIYGVGKYNFQSVLIAIAFAEILKYFISVVYIKKKDINLFKKHEELSPFSYLKSLLSKSKLREGYRTFFTVFIMTVVYYIVSVLCGAEIFSKHEETFMFSALLSVLTIFPICVNLGSLSIIPVLLGCRPSNKLESLLYQNLYLTVFGAWLGAFVIPLDWDRPWQQWPISCSCGAMAGFLLSHILTIFQIRPVHLKRKS